MTKRQFYIIILVLGVILGSVWTSSAQAHGYRHGHNLTASQIKQHPSWLKMPGHTCNRDFVGDIYVTYDDDLGWVIIWKCRCVPHPNGVTYICWWQPVRILPENVTNRRILREIRDVQNGQRYTRPVLRILAGGYVFRKHAPGDHCHWHNERGKPAIVSRKI